MAVMVQFKDDTVSFVTDYEFSDLILSDRISAFRRGREWVTLSVGRPPQKSYALNDAAPQKNKVTTKGKIWRQFAITDFL